MSVTDFSKIASSIGPKGTASGSSDSSDYVTRDEVKEIVAAVISQDYSSDFNNDFSE